MNYTYPENPTMHRLYKTRDYTIRLYRAIATSHKKASRLNRKRYCKYC